VTARRDFKRRVRARQERTGESYSTARRRVEGGAPQMDVIEMEDVTPIAAALGFTCGVVAHAAILARVPAETALRRLRALLVAPEAEDETDVMRALAFQNRTPRQIFSEEGAELLRAPEFFARARVGLGGAIGGGRLVVLHDVVPILYATYPFAPYPGLAVRVLSARILVTTLEMFSVEGPLPFTASAAPRAR
jgi:hypothetical protein